MLFTSLKGISIHCLALYFCSQRILVESHTNVYINFALLVVTSLIFFADKYLGTYVWDGDEGRLTAFYVINN